MGPGILMLTHAGFLLVFGLFVFFVGGVNFSKMFC